MSEAPCELPEGWCRDAEGALRRETVHSMLRRMIGWDYRQRAIYEITVVLADRASQALGRLEVLFSATVSPSAEPATVSPRAEPATVSPRAEPATVSPRAEPATAVSGARLEGAWMSVDEARRKLSAMVSPGAVRARVVPSALGVAVARCWESIPRFYPQVKILAKRVMPDHFHGILFVTAPLDCHLGQVIKGFKTGCNKAARALGMAMPLFAAGFNDAILFRAGQLGNWFHYFADNPRRLALKLLFAGLFRNVRELAVPVQTSLVQTSPVQTSPVQTSPTVSARPEPVSARPEIAHFSALGNRFLLDRPLAQVQVSRRDFGYRREPKPGGGLKICRDAQGEPIVDFSTPAFAERREALFAAAKHGAVLISPCVSDGERQIAREALAAGFRLVALKNKGFAKLQKPAGRAFDACVEGRLLMLAPAAWPYQPGEKPMTRYDAVAMNRLCQWLAGPGAAEINYHGMKPANIDALARAAARVENGVA